MEDTPNMVLVIVVSLIIIAVGIFTVAVFVSQVGMESSYKETFDVTDPSTDQIVTLEYKPSETPTVWQYNGIQWLQVDASYVSYLNEELTVQSGGLQG